MLLPKVTYWAEHDRGQGIVKHKAQQDKMLTVLTEEPV